MNAVLKYDILENHNDYELPISRSKEEEIRRDPFSLGSNVKGLTRVNHNRNLSNYAEELVANYAKFDGNNYDLDLKDLSEYDQNELARLYIESNEREISECIYGSDFSINNEFTCALLAMLQDDSEENRANFAEVTRKNVLTYYKYALQELLNNTCHYYLHEMMNEQGLYARHDMEHGDIIWTR